MAQKRMNRIPADFPYQPGEVRLFNGNPITKSATTMSQANMKKHRGRTPSQFVEKCCLMEVYLLSPQDMEYRSNPRNYPLYRIGNIALITRIGEDGYEDKIPMSLSNSPEELYMDSLTDQYPHLFEWFAKNKGTIIDELTGYVAQVGQKGISVDEQLRRLYPQAAPEPEPLPEPEQDTKKEKKAK